MILPGRLATTTLGDLLGACFRARISGVLELTEDAGPVAGRAHRLLLRTGLIQGVETMLGAPRLGELLVNNGALSRRQHLELLFRLQEVAGKTTGQWLAEFRWVEPDTLRTTMRQQLADRLAALYHLSDARVAYRVARATATAANAVAAQPLTPEVFLHGKPRMRDRRAAVESREAPHRDLGLRESTRVRALLSLGLAPHSSTSDIKQAFHRMVARLHPDRHIGAPPSQQQAVRQRFAQVVNAYNTLMTIDAVA